MKYRCPKCGHTAETPLKGAEVYHWCRKNKNRFTAIPAVEEEREK